MRKLEGLKFIGLFLCGAVLLAACGGGDGGTNVVTQGTLNLSLTDSATEDYQAVYVTIDEVEVHSDAGGWQTVATPKGTFNLLELVNGVRENLGVTFLDSGQYTQLRLLLGATADAGLNILTNPHPFANYLIDQANNALELKIPPAKIMIVHGFDISENQTTELILDFDAMKSVVKAGNSGKHLLKPTIKVLGLKEAAIVSGLVSDGVNGIEGALISTQIFNNDLSLDAAERVQVERSTIAAADDATTATEDETGEYQLFLPAGSYNLLVLSTGFEPLCRSVNLVAGMQTTENFFLTATQTGTVSGTVEIVTDTVAEDQHITIDFRQAGLCFDPTAIVNVKTIQVAENNRGTYSVALPAGIYQAVASTEGQTTQITSVIVSQNATTAYNVAF